MLTLDNRNLRPNNALATRNDRVSKQERYFPIAVTRIVVDNRLLVVWSCLVIYKPNKTGSDNEVGHKR